MLIHGLGYDALLSLVEMIAWLRWFPSLALVLHTAFIVTALANTHQTLASGRTPPKSHRRMASGRSNS